MMPTLCRDCCEIVDTAGKACDRCGGTRLLTHAEIDTLGIAHIDCDAFYASVEKRDRPELRNEPVIIGGTGGRGVVVTACYIARQSGARSAMPMFHALELCPSATVIRPDMAKYKSVSEQIRVIFGAATSVIEPLSLDEAYLDLTDDYRTEAPPAAEALAAIAIRIEREVGITVSVGLSCNKFLAKLASDFGKPRGFSIIGRAEAKDLLAPLSVRKIHGVGAVTARRMEAGGLSTIGDLQKLPERDFTSRFGKFGARLAQFSHGRDERRVTPWRPTKSISAETTFRSDTGSAGRLRELADPLCERVAAHLGRKGLAGRSVVLKLKTSDFQILTRTRTFAHPTQREDLIRDSIHAMIDNEADGRTFRLIGVGVGDLDEATVADPADLFSFAERA
jgi:DNA polymerase-4